MKRSMLISVLLSFLLISCSDNSVDPNPAPGQQGTYKVTGFISHNGIPIEGVDVIVNNAVNWRTRTGADGRFLLEGITKGEYTFRAEKYLEDSRIISQELNLIIVNDITDVGEIRLPNPLNLYITDASGVNDGRVTISWSRSIDDGFLEYKLFRKDNPSLDDVNAELIYATSSPGDTSFTHMNIRSGQKHYYRVLAYLNGQKAAGSNFESVDIPELNLVLNSGFENSSDGAFPDVWLQSISGNPGFNYFVRSQEAVHSDASSLKIYYDHALANPPEGRNPWGGLMQSISKVHLIEGREYTMSFWSKSDNGSFQVRLVRNSNLEDHLVSYIVPDKTDWSEQKFTFRVDNSNYYELWISVRPGFAVNGTVTGYLDDIKILR
jgi:hypothetical protein